MTFLYRIYHYIAITLYVLMTGRREVVGLENVPRKGPLILVGNHIAGVDPILVFAYFPRQVYFMAKHEIFERFPRTLNWMAPQTGAFPVHRERVDRAALRHAETLLAKGHIVGIYPEGTRGQPGELRDAHAGVVFLALKTGVPILPVGTSGTERAFRKGFPYLTWTTVRLAVGPPFRLEDLVENPRSADRHELAMMVMERVARLLPPEYRPALLGDQPAALAEM
jgi:1-acyl-sn-glycerol-3-phosphate acyltransferase